VCSSARRTVHGWPSSLLKEPGGATVGPIGSSTWAIRSLVEVLPDDPVTPMTVSPVFVSRSTASRASRAKPARTAAPEPSRSPVSATESACE
jgi:hypothetical protein